MILEANPGDEIRTARKSAMTTQRIAASVCGLGMNAYINREKDQDQFKLGELKKLYAACGTDGKDTIAAYMAENFPAQVDFK